MKLPYILSSLSLLCSVHLLGETVETDENGEIAIRSYYLTRGDTLPSDHFEDATDPYLEGYIQALVDIHYSEFSLLVTVKDHKVYLSNLPKNDMLASSIINFVEDIPGVKSVVVTENLTPKEEAAKEIYTERPKVNGIWFPQSTVLFAPLVADPRQPVNSVAYRYGDRVIGKNVAAVSLGDDFPIFRWKNMFYWRGDLQIGIEAGIWAVFNYSHVSHKGGQSCELVNTDYLVGIPLTYASNRWSFRLRPYHISSHLGDEFLCNKRKWVDRRKNPSYEAVDFFASYQVSKGLRVYLGPGIIIHSDTSYKMKTFYLEYGAEYRFWGKKFDYHSLYGTCFLAIHLENWQVRHWDEDGTIKAGYEWSQLQGVGRKMRLYVDYHAGYSYEGQFFKDRTSYGEIGFSWGF